MPGLLVKSKHYSGQMRREALMALQKLLKEADEEEIGLCLSALMEILSRGMIDEDVNVHGLVLSTFKLLLPRTDEASLGIFFPQWLQFLQLALTHIEPDIRRGAVPFVNVAVERLPALMAPSLVKIMLALVPLLPITTAKKGKTNLTTPSVVLLNAIKVYCTLAKVVEFEECFNYEWMEVQSRPLHVWRKPPSSSSLESIGEAQVALIEDKLLESLSESWLDASATLSQQGKLSAGQREKVAPLLSTMSSLRSFAVHAGFGEVLFWRAFPPRMLNVLGANGQAKLELHINDFEQIK
jgi:hypothetical protein